MPDKQIYYCMSGPAHLPYLVVSLYTLRKHMPDVDVCVYAWPESWEIAERISQDERLGIHCERWDPEYRGKNDQFICKQVLAMLSSAEVKIYLDADTIICDDLTPLFDMATKHGFVATQFCDWITNIGVIKERILRLVDREGINQFMVQRLQRRPWPSVNGGVFACKPTSFVLTEWYRRTMAVIDLFIADETCLHTFVTERSNSHFKIHVAKASSKICWNCSPKHQPHVIPDEAVKIWHFHGDTNTRPDKSKKGFDLWHPTYQECLRDNIGFMTEWIDRVENKWLNQLETVRG